MAFITLLGLIWLLKGNASQIHFTNQDFFPNLSTFSNQSFLLAVLFGLIGIEASVTHADEVINPAKTFPRAILLSSLLIIVSLILSSLAIAVVVPIHELNIVTGLLQAFKLFFLRYHLDWLMPIIAILIIIGGIAGMATWILSPAKGLLIATQDGSAPAIFAKMNKHGSPAMILFAQGIICTLLCSLFLWMPSVSSSYWILTVMTAQLAMLVYIAVFAAAIYLRYKQPAVERAFKIPGGKLGIWLVGSLGICSCLVAILLGFVPPERIPFTDWFKYEITLMVGIVGLTLPPLFIYRWRKQEYS